MSHSYKVGSLVSFAPLIPERPADSIDRDWERRLGRQREQFLAVRFDRLVGHWVADELDVETNALELSESVGVVIDSKPTYSAPYFEPKKTTEEIVVLYNQQTMLVRKHKIQPLES